MFACGIALFWAFIQYKNLVTGFVGKQAELGMAWLRSEVQAAVAAEDLEPTPELVERVLIGVDSAAPTENAVYYYQSNNTLARPLALGGGPMGAPRLPWYSRARMQLAGMTHHVDRRVGRLEASEETALIHAETHWHATDTLAQQVEELAQFMASEGTARYARANSPAC